MISISPNYHDPGGRDMGALRADLEKLVKNFSDLRIVPFKVADIALVNNNLISTVDVAWRASTQDDALHKHLAATN